MSLAKDLAGLEQVLKDAGGQFIRVTGTNNKLYRIGHRYVTVPIPHGTENFRLVKNVEAEIDRALKATGAYERVKAEIEAREAKRRGDKPSEVESKIKLRFGPPIPGTSTPTVTESTAASSSPLVVTAGTEPPKGETVAKDEPNTVTTNDAKPTATAVKTPTPKAKAAKAPPENRLKCNFCGKTFTMARARGSHEMFKHYPKRAALVKQHLREAQARLHGGPKGAAVTKRTLVPKKPKPVRTASTVAPVRAAEVAQAKPWTAAKLATEPVVPVKTVPRAERTLTPEQEKKRIANAEYRLRRSLGGKLTSLGTPRKRRSIGEVLPGDSVTPTKLRGMAKALRGAAFEIEHLKAQNARLHRDAASLRKALAIIGRTAR